MEILLLAYAFYMLIVRKNANVYMIDINTNLYEIFNEVIP